VFLGFFFEQKYFLIRAEKMILVFTKYFFRIFYVNPKKMAFFLFRLKNLFHHLKLMNLLYMICVF